MKLIINIRGSNASGKSTVVKEYLKRYKSQVVCFNGNYVTYIKDLDGYIVGRYDVSSGGCDRYSSFEEVFDQIVYLVKNKKPKFIVYEGMLLSKNFKKTYLMSKISDKFGYNFCCIVLKRDFCNVIKLLEERNNGKEYDAANILRTYEAVLSSSDKLKKSGVNVIYKNVDRLEKNEMWKILQEVIKL